MKIWFLSWAAQWIIAFLIAKALLQFCHINIGFIGTFIVGSIVSVPIFLFLKRIFKG